MKLKPPKRKKYNSLHQLPGEVTYVGKKETVSSLEIIDYDKKSCQRYESEKLEDAYRFKETEHITWINVNGLNNTRQIEKLGKHYNLHPLIVEDIVNTEQRPKIEAHEDYLFLVVKMLYHDENEAFTKEHISIVLGRNHVLTFQEANDDVFDRLRDRIVTSKGIIRSVGADYLMYSILDAIIDNYFIIIEEVGEKIQQLEDELFLKNPRESIAVEIQALKRKILRIRKAVLPLREVIKQLEKSEHPFIEKRTINYLRDINDHIIQNCENIEIYREMTWGLMDMYMTSISNKMNEVMKVLTIMASIFIPLTFIVGVYGMNFDYMPELDEHYAYFIVWGVMILVILGMVWYFKRKNWL